jgi:hypothetical protein
MWYWESLENSPENREGIVHEKLQTSGGNHWSSFLPSFQRKSKWNEVKWSEMKWNESCRVPSIKRHLLKFRFLSLTEICPCDQINSQKYSSPAKIGESTDNRLWIVEILDLCTYQMPASIVAFYWRVRCDQSRGIRESLPRELKATICLLWSLGRWSCPKWSEMSHAGFRSSSNTFSNCFFCP